MIHSVSIGCTLWVLLAVASADARGQPRSPAKRPNPYAPDADPHVRRANRERAVALVGPGARDFVETYGEDAVAAIFACSKRIRAMLTGFYASGGLDSLPRPRDLLRAIGQPRHGDDVAIWVMCHADELADKDCIDAFLASPLEYTLGLKPLETGAAEVRALRANQVQMPAWPSLGSLSGDDRRALAGGIGLVVIFGLVLWRRRRSSVC
jgi:hypothetical protein